MGGSGDRGIGSLTLIEPPSLSLPHKGGGNVVALTFGIATACGREVANVVVSPPLRPSQRLRAWR